MKTILSKVLNIRPARFLVAAFFGALLLFSHALPTFAVSSSLTDGEEQLQQIEQESKEVLKSNPRSLEEVQADTEGGLNGVQGKANINKMSNPQNTGMAKSVEQQIDDKLKELK
ncbi:MAG: low temperature-induced protein [Microcoleaceae cyanobacterium]